MTSLEWKKFVDFEDVAVLVQSDPRMFPEVDQWTRDISPASSGPDWLNCLMAQEVHGCVSVRRDLSFAEELPPEDTGELLSLIFLFKYWKLPVIIIIFLEFC